MFFVPEALERLTEVPDDVIVPAVVLAEWARHLAKNGIPPGDLLEALDANAFHVQAFGVDQALRWAPTVHDDDAWRRLARDTMIAGHVGESDVLWTTNPSDFEEIGLPEDRIATVETPDRDPSSA